MQKEINKVKELIITFLVFVIIFILAGWYICGDLTDFLSTFRLTI